MAKSASMLESWNDSLATQAVFWSVVVGLAISAGVVIYAGPGAVLEAFHRASWGLIIAYISVSALIAVGLTLKWKVALEAYGVRLPFYTLFIYRLIGFAVNYVTPTAHVGGEPARAILLRKQGIPLKVGLSSVIVDRSLDLVFNAAMFFLGAIILLNIVAFPLPARITILILSVIMLAIAGVFVYRVLNRRKVLVPLLRMLRLHKRRGWPRIRRLADEIEELTEHFYMRKQRHFRAAVLIDAILWVLMFLEYKVALAILGYDAPVFAVFLFLTGVGLAYSLPIPAALGVLELGQISAGALLRVSPAIGVALALMIRVRDIIWTLLGAGLILLFHVNAFNLYARSLAAAAKYNFETLSLELKR